jgi:SAM-dependent methyltransferase
MEKRRSGIFMQHRDRWQIAQMAERKGRKREPYTPESISRAKSQFITSLEMLEQCGITFDNSQKLLDIGSAGTSVFSVLETGQRYCVDPLLNHIFTLYPFIQEIREYKGVHFISSRIEEVDFSFRFDLIFMINLLDHTRNPREIVDKVTNLLASGGHVIVTLDTYNSKRIRDIIQFFDPDPAHPHHFMRNDVERLFQNYSLVKYDSDILGYHKVTKVEKRDASLLLWRIIHLPVGRIAREIRSLGIMYGTKHIVCHAILLLLYFMGIVDVPIQPLALRRLFIFQRI